MSTAVARNLMAEMKLFGMSSIFDKAVMDATHQQWSCTEFINVLLQAEADQRTERKTGGLIKAAKFAKKSRFEDFDFTAQRSLTKTDIKDLYSLEWLRQGRPVLLVGQTGVGKSFIAQAAGMQACLRGHSVLFITVTDWLEHLALARTSGTYLRFRERLLRPALVIFDNMGMRKLTASEAQDLCEILDVRTGDKSVIFTTQTPLQHWSEVIPDPVILDAIRDRLEHAALTFNITGESYREVLARHLSTPAQNAEA